MSCVQRTLVLPVSREVAWRAVTEPEELREWLADEVELEVREGGAARFAWSDGSRRVGVVEECAVQRRIAWRWRRPEESAEEESIVELTLDDVEEGTRITVLEVRARELAVASARLAPAAGGAWGLRMQALAACPVA